MNRVMETRARWLHQILPLALLLASCGRPGPDVGQTPTALSPAPTPESSPSPTPTPDVVRQWGKRARADSSYEVYIPVGRPNTLTCWVQPSTAEVATLDVYFEQPVWPRAIELHLLRELDPDLSFELIDSDGQPFEAAFAVERTSTRCPWIYRLAVDGSENPVIGLHIGSRSGLLGAWNAIDAVELIGVPSGEPMDLGATFFPTPTPPPAGQRALHDRSDDQTGLYQLHVVYALFADDKDRERDLDGSIARSVKLANDWMSEQTGGARLRVDTYQGALDITFVRFDETHTEALDRYRAQYESDHKRDPRWSIEDYFMEYLEARFSKTGFYQDGKYYIVYLEQDHPHSCGYSMIADVLGVFFLGNHECGYGRLGVDAHAWNTEFVLLHEVLHGLGFVAACAPHSIADNSVHVNDSDVDLMYAYVPEGFQNKLDVGNDDYFRHGIEGCPDFANSAFLEPLPSEPEAPDGWPATQLLPK